MSASYYPAMHDEHRAAHQRLAAALLELDPRAVLACRLDPAFISENEAERAEAAALCQGCPVFTECDDAGRFERFGVWAGVDRSPQRTTAPPRKAPR